MEKHAEFATLSPPFGCGTAAAEPGSMEITDHAHQRCHERYVTLEQVLFVMLWGTEYKRPCGRVAIHLGHRDHKYAIKSGARMLEGVLNLAVILERNQMVVTLITVIRTSDRSRFRVPAQRQFPSPKGRRGRTQRGPRWARRTHQPNDS